MAESSLGHLNKLLSVSAGTGEGADNRFCSMRSSFTRASVCVLVDIYYIKFLLLNFEIWGNNSAPTGLSIMLKSLLFLLQVTASKNTSCVGASDPQLVQGHTCNHAPFLAAGGGEGPQRPPVSQAGAVAERAAQAGGCSGGLSRAGRWGQEQTPQLTEAGSCG